MKPVTGRGLTNPAFTPELTVTVSPVLPICLAASVQYVTINTQAIAMSNHHSAWTAISGVLVKWSSAS